MFRERDTAFLMEKKSSQTDRLVARTTISKMACPLIVPPAGRSACIRYLTQAERYCPAGGTKMSVGYGEVPAQIHMGMW